jgi:hypothetical protein
MLRKLHGLGCATGLLRRLGCFANLLRGLGRVANLLAAVLCHLTGDSRFF